MGGVLGPVGAGGQPEYRTARVDVQAERGLRRGRVQGQASAADVDQVRGEVVVRTADAGVRAVPLVLHARLPAPREPGVAPGVPDSMEVAAPTGNGEPCDR